MASEERYLTLPSDLYIQEYITFSHSPMHTSTHTPTRTYTYAQTYTQTHLGALRITNACFESLTLNLYKGIVVNAVFSVFYPVYFSFNCDPAGVASLQSRQQLGATLFVTLSSAVISSSLSVFLCGYNLRGQTDLLSLQFL